MSNIAVSVSAAPDLLELGLVSALSQTPETTVIRETCRRTASCPDVAIVAMGEHAELACQVIRDICAQSAKTRVLCLLPSGEPALILGVVLAGASGCLPQGCSVRELQTAVRALFETGTYLPAELSQALVLHLANSGTSPAPETAKPESELTPKEFQTLKLIADGLATKQIAGELGVSVKTISTHRSQLMRKLDRNSVAELTKFAIMHGLTTVE